MYTKMLNAIFVILMSLVKGLHKELLFEIENKVCVNCKHVIRKEIERDIDLKKLNQTNTLCIGSIKKALNLTDLDVSEDYIKQAALFLDIEIKEWSIWDYWPLSLFRSKK